MAATKQELLSTALDLGVEGVHESMTKADIQDAIDDHLTRQARPGTDPEADEPPFEPAEVSGRDTDRVVTPEAEDVRRAQAAALEDDDLTPMPAVIVGDRGALPDAIRSRLFSKGAGDAILAEITAEYLKLTPEAQDQLIAAYMAMSDDEMEGAILATRDQLIGSPPRDPRYV